MKSTASTVVLETVADLKAWRSQVAGRPGSVLGFVPTMGALHAGHMSLVRLAAEQCDHVLVSIFVNPLQFGKGEDFDRYPRPFERDLEFCRKAGVHAVFHPAVDAIYPGQGQSTVVVPPRSLIEHLCGAFRPGHFEGVATVVTKLFGMATPEQAYFGEKDFQQLAVIRRMTADLNLPVSIKAAPTLREADGLAMSSRNVYLNQEERERAPVLYQTLCHVRDRALSGSVSLSEALEDGRVRLRQCAGVELQYLEACDPDSLAPLETTRASMVILVAAKFGQVRLIDNVIVR